jgi:hypothetical protein
MHSNISKFFARTLRTWGRFGLSAALTLGLVLCVSGCVLNLHNERVEKSATFDGVGWRVLRTTLAATETLRVQGFAQPRVVATAGIEGLVNNAEAAARWQDGLDLAFTQNDDVLTFALAIKGAATDERTAFAPGQGSLSPEAWHLADLVLDVPTSADLELTSGQGDVQVIGVTGLVSVDNGTGDVDVQSLGVVNVTNNTGNITAFAAVATLTTGTGNLDADIAGVAILRAGTGNIRATLGQGGDVDNGTGNINLTLADADFGHLSVTNGTGNIDITLPPGLGVDIEAHSQTGNVALPAGATLAQVDGRTVTRIGVGGNRIVAVCNTGNINIHVAQADALK